MFEFEVEAKATEKLNEIEEQILKSDFKELMQLPTFRRFIWKIMELGRPFASSFTGNSGTFYNDGLKFIPLWIFNLIMNECPEKWTLMGQELNAKKEQRKKKIIKKLNEEEIND